MGDDDKFKPDFEGLPLNPNDQQEEDHLNQGQKPPNLPREELSKRFISRKIEEMLQGEKLPSQISLEQSPKKTENTEEVLIPNETPKIPEIPKVERDVEKSDQGNLNEFEDEEELISQFSDFSESTRPKKSEFQNSMGSNSFKEANFETNNQEWGFFRKYYLVIFLLLFIAAGWTFFLINHYEVTPKESLSVATVSIQIENSMNWRNSAPIISTPLIADANADGLVDIIWGDNLGYLRAVDPRTRELIYAPLLGAPIVASLTTVEVNGIPPAEILVATDQGSFFTINAQGGYLYRSREEFFNEALYGKPLILEVSEGKQVLFFTGMKGKVWAVDSRYGEVLWVNENSPLALANEGIFSSPILIKHLATAGELALTAVPSKDKSVLSLEDRAEEYSLLVLGETGSVAALDPATGALRWTKKFAASFRATPLAIAMDSREVVVLVDISGKIFVLATTPKLNPSADIVERGKVLVEKSLSELSESSSDEGVVSSPVSFANQGSGKDIKTVLIATESGKLIAGRFSLGAGGRYDLALQTVYQNDGEGFIASPVIADFNQNQSDDVLLVSRSGKVLLLENSSAENGADEQTATEEFIKFSELTPAHELLYNVTSSPVVADLNGDGHLEVVVAGENGVLTVLTLRTSPQAVFAPHTKIVTQFLYNELNRR